MSHQHTVIVRVEFPALDNLVAFLRENEQSAIDALTAKVVDATARLKTKTEALQGAVQKEQ